ncbi:MAG: type II toxin-antitoxin system RelE/ParE family toxin [Oscillospiraceae bacterium]|nr:type II toxin-antitoxin system RelE/ParE family toxin [Oscillospiraceae bacterium]
MTKIEWSQRAVDNLHSIEDYIAADSPIQAKKVVNEIISRVEDLQVFPEIGSPVLEFPEMNLRQLIKYSYRIIYSYDGKVVHIITVIHGKRDFTKAFFDK